VPPVVYRGERSGLGIDVALDDWLVVPLTVEATRSSGGAEDETVAPTHEVRLAFRVHRSGIDWNEPTRGAAASGTCDSSATDPRP
jgi:hypothetical protein